ncbi:MAG: ArsR family transcriptional regulator [Candidatus Freyarchaeum deiterrae]
MCGENYPNNRLNKLQNLMGVLHCPTRWLIIDFIGEGTKSTKEIYEHLIENNEKLTPSGLYYHLSELKNGEIIEVAEYKEDGGGAPKKVWKLKQKKIVIDLLKPEGDE